MQETAAAMMSVKISAANSTFRDMEQSELRLIHTSTQCRAQHPFYVKFIRMDNESRFRVS